MNVTLNVAGKTLQQQFKAPCMGADAKALGACLLEKEFGKDAAFQFYQEAPGMPKAWLNDDEPVVDGIILSFTVPQPVPLGKHDKILAMLAAPMLRDLVCRWATLLLEVSVTEPTAATTTLQEKLASSSVLRQRLAAALASINAKPSAEQLVAALDRGSKLGGGDLSGVDALEGGDGLADGGSKSGDDGFKSGDGGFKSGDGGLVPCVDGAQLKGMREEMEEMRNSGMLQLLGSKYPVECLIIQHHEVFLQLLA